MFLTSFLPRWRSLPISSSFLIALLQRTPMLRALLTVESEIVAPAGSLLRAALAPAVALGAVHTLAGASTQLVSNVTLPAKATVGQPFTMAVVITGLGVSFAQSWDVTNTLPPGVTAQGGVVSGGFIIVNPSTGVLTLTGTPTTVGTYSFTARGYQYTNRTGPATSGATSIVVAAAPNSAPVITRQPAAQTVTVGSTATLAVTYTGNPTPTFQWLRNGSAVVGGNGPTLTLTNVTPDNAGNYTITITNSLGTATSIAAPLTVNAVLSAPVFATAPQPQTATAGGAVIFTVDVSGVPSPTLQWFKDGTGVAGATGTTLILNDVQTAGAGLYSVTASNASGSTTSPAARLLVIEAATAPVFSTQPATLMAAAGSTVVFNAAATGTPTPAFQWQHDGTNLPGATGPTLVLGPTTAADAGSYTVVATNSLGGITSTAANLTVVGAALPSRLVNLSILTPLAAGENIMMGAVVGGVGTFGTKALLARAAGPSLSPLGVTNVLPDPTMALIASAASAIVATNNDWSGSATLSNVFSQVGAFAYTSSASKDAAIFQSSLTPGSYTVQVGDAGAGAGTVIAEIYDATPTNAFSATTPRLINVSVLKQIAAGSALVAGFVIDGRTAKTVLIRAIGPGLAGFGVYDTTADPQLVLFQGSTKIAENDNWGGAPQLTSAGISVGAFAIANSESKDAMLLVTLAPGNYSAQVSGATGGGAALVEVYEVP